MIKFDKETQNFELTDDAAIAIRLGIVLHLNEVMKDKGVRTLMITNVMRETLLEITEGLLKSTREKYSLGGKEK